MSSEKLIPEEGLYVSKKDPSLRLVVTDVDVVDDEEEDEGDSFSWLQWSRKVMKMICQRLDMNTCQMNGSSLLKLTNWN